MQLGVRFYDPEVGRFTQRDPMHSGLNDYDYANGNPVIAGDPTSNVVIVIAGGCALTGAEAVAIFGSAASVLCGANKECREAIAAAGNYLVGMVQSAQRCCKSIRCKLEIHPPDHYFWRPKLAIPPWKKCWMNHIQLMCWREGMSNSLFINQRVGFGPCYKYNGGKEG